MPANLKSNRWQRLMAWVIAGLFIAGFFVHPIGLWTGTVLGVWFVGTQPPGRGFLWMTALTILFSAPAIWHSFAVAGPARSPVQMASSVALVLLAIPLSVLPFTIHRLVSPHLPGFSSTFAFPLAAVAVPALAAALKIGPSTEIVFFVFFVSWFAAVVVWAWNLEFNRAKVKAGTSVFAVVSLGAAACAPFFMFGGVTLPSRANTAFAWTCLVGVLFLGIWALLRSAKEPKPHLRPDAVARLQSPSTGHSMHLETGRAEDTLVSSSGERFPVRRGIPNFTKPQDLTGDNGKYSHVYATIAGFYDDTQRVFCGLKGFDGDAYVRSYMRLLQVKAGNSVLETSVGTGLNFRYLPHGVQLSGLDLSPEMLRICQRNLRRRELNADLYLGNAESLPFADSSFDVVFHVGGINFFNDRAKAIREMIRVAKPGSLLLIADETEKHVKEVYEKTPGGLYRNRKEPVSAPVDLVPPEMLDVHLELLKEGMGYALTFRKPCEPDVEQQILVAAEHHSV